MQEEWKDIIGYEGYYQISNLGKIKSLERVVMSQYSDRKIKTVFKENIFKFRVNRKGYSVACLYANKKQKLIRVHRLVAIHFIDNPFNKPEVNHIDGNKTNNTTENLEWVNARENTCHFRKSKKSSSEYIGVGFEKDRNKWRSTIHHKGKPLHLGRFNTEEEAYETRVKFEQENNIENKYK